MKSSMNKFKKGLAVAGLTMSGVAGIAGCAHVPEGQTKTQQEQLTKSDGTTYTEKEMEEIRKVISQKNNFLDKIQEEYKIGHNKEEIKREDIGIIQNWKEDKDFPVYYHLIVVDKKNRKILSTLSVKMNSDKKEIKEIKLDEYNDPYIDGSKENPIVYKNDENFLEYKTDSIYYEFEQRENNKNSNEITSTVVETEQKIIIEENSRLNLKYNDDDYEIAD